MTKENLSVPTLIIIIATTVYSFSSMSTAFYMMGIKSLLWFVISGLFYFVPYTLIVAQYTRKYGDRYGTIYDWLRESLSPKAAFVTICLWYCGYFTWIISLFMKLAIPLSILLFGEDITTHATLFGLPTQYSMALFAIMALFLITWLTSRGFQHIISFLKVSSFAMIFLLFLSIASNGLLISRHPHEFLPNLVQSFQMPSFFKGTNNHLLSQLPFFIFSITAFGGVDTVASLADRTTGSRSRFPKALLYSLGIVIALYLGGIVLWSGAHDLSVLRAQNHVHLGNLMYTLMGELAQRLTETFSLSAPHAALLFQLFIRYTAFTLFTSYLGLLSSITYGPLKSLVTGTPKALWPGRTAELNAHKMPARALWCQAAVVAFCILLLSFNSRLLGNLFNQLTYMTDVARALPYFVVAMSYPFFLKKAIIPLEKMIIPNQKANVFLAHSVCLCILIAVAFQIWQPLMTKSYQDAFSLILGPAAFIFLAERLFQKFEKRAALRLEKM